ncbi:galactose-specific lectin nattectin [Fundulus heteroclitus]|uniref:galactose-specific lectin nattectin n=1 Tax=Fundulus heteroclitus TaxID=8078 RepID=UPI0006447E84|nr:galactose-specific lectin nattectin [Fundulus heteroclitus]
MIWFLFLFGLSLAAEPPADGQELKLERGGCPMFWFSFEGRCYKYFGSKMTWGEAELQCVSEGANLVSIHSLGEHEFVNLLIQNFDPSLTWTWIGLTDLYKEGAWVWSDGSKYSRSFWNDRQPDNAENIEHCGHTNAGSNLNWNDNMCSYKLPFVCATHKACP